MSRCIIIGPLYDGAERALLMPGGDDLLLCADGGYEKAVLHGLKPQLVIGDFDTMPAERVQDVPKYVLPVMKDDTDLAACLKEGRARGYRSFVLAGCLGGRLDHTLATLQCMADCALRGESATAVDAMNRVTMLTPGTYTLERLDDRLLSLLAFTDRVEGVVLTGTQWPLEDAVLTSRYPLGVSNRILGSEAQLTFRTGLLLVTWSQNLTCL